MFLHVSVIHSVHRGEYLTRYPPTRYTPLDQVHPPGPGTPPQDQAHPHAPGTPPTSRTRYTCLRDQVHPPGPGTPPRPGTPPWPGTPPRNRACWEIRSTWGRFESYWIVILYDLFPPGPGGAWSPRTLGTATAICLCIHLISKTEKRKTETCIAVVPRESWETRAKISWCQKVTYTTGSTGVSRAVVNLWANF